MIIKQLFIDTETTGIDPKKNGLFNIGGVIVNDGRIEEFDLFCDVFTEDTFDLGAMEKNGFTNEQIAKLPDPEVTFNQFIGILDKHIDKYDKEDKFYVFGYFSEFDCQFLRQWFWNNGDQYFGSRFHHPWLDVSVIAMYYLMEKGERHLLENFKLTTVARYLGIDIDDNKSHTSLYDAQLAKQVYDCCTGTGSFSDALGYDDDIPF